MDRFLDEEMAVKLGWLESNNGLYALPPLLQRVLAEVKGHLANTETVRGYPAAGKTNVELFQDGLCPVPVAAPAQAEELIKVLDHSIKIGANGGVHKALVLQILGLLRYALASERLASEVCPEAKFLALLRVEVLEQSLVLAEYAR